MDSNLDISTIANLNRFELKIRDGMKSLLIDYISHNDSKSDGDIGGLERKHLEMDKDSIKYIGKEANNIEFSMVRGVFAEDNNEYVNHQKKLREIIDGLTLDDALKIGIDRREFYRLKKKFASGKIIILRKKTLDQISVLFFNLYILNS